MEDDVHFILDLMKKEIKYYEERIYEAIKEPCYGGVERIELIAKKHAIENLIDDIRAIFDIEGECEDDI